MVVDIVVSLGLLNAGHQEAEAEARNTKRELVSLQMFLHLVRFSASFCRHGRRCLICSDNEL